MMSNVLNILIRNNLERPNVAAVIGDHPTLTYAELYESAVQFAAYLQRHNISRRQPIGILLKNGPQVLIVYYGCLLAGVLPVLLPNYLSTNKLTYNFNKLKIDTVIFDTEFQKVVDEVELKKGTPLIKLNWIEFQSNGAGQRNVEVTQFNNNGSYEPAAIIFTDGNCGFPKITVHSYHSLMTNAANCVKLFGGLHDIKLISTLPIFHYIAHSFIPHTVALAGGTVCLPDDLDPETVCQTISDHKINTIVGPPYFYDYLVANVNPGKAESLKYCIVCGGSLQAETWQTLKKDFKVFITELYGMAETHMLTFVHDESERNESLIGRPYPGIDINIVAQTGAQPGKQSVGELEIRTNSLMLNYFEDLNRRPVRSGNWFRTGDLVRQSDNGALIFETRLADTINRYGYTINPAVIEKILKKHPAIRDVAACPFNNIASDGQIKLLVVLNESAVLSNDELMDYCHQNLPGYLWPELIEFVPRLEYDLSGKILRNQLNKG